MNLKRNSNFVLINTSYVIISSFICLALVFRTAQTFTGKTNLDIVYKDVANDFSHPMPSLDSTKHSTLWRARTQRIPSMALLSRIPLKNQKQNERFQYYLKTHKRQMEELPPPGFVGARGRRNQYNSNWDYKNMAPKRNVEEEYQTLTEVFPDLWPNLKDQPIESTTEELMAARLASGKRPDSIVYKDGFLGVRG